MGAAAAQVAIQRLVDLLHGGIAGFIQQALGGDDHPAGAVATLGGLLVDKGCLQGVQIFRRAQPLDGDDPGSPEGSNLQLAGGDRFTVDQDVTRPTLFQTTGMLDSIEAQIISEDI